MQGEFRKRASVWGLVGYVLVILVWNFHRAASQALTLDEATTFLFWVYPAESTQWTPHSNNHILNSVLMRMCVSALGNAESVLRLPALFGGFCLLLAAAMMAYYLASSMVSRLCIVTLLTLNPFVMDYMVVARGYGLALGFFYSALLVLLLQLKRSPERRSLRAVVMVSVLMGLCISSNFSFALAALVLLGLTAMVVLRSRPLRFVFALKLFASALLPAVIMVLAICRSAVWQFPRAQLFWGVDSLAQTFLELFDATFARLNEAVAATSLASLLVRFREAVVPVTGAYLLGAMLMLWWCRRVRDSAARRYRWQFAMLCAGMTALVALLHYGQFRLLALPLPYERTSLFFVPLLTLSVVGLHTALPPTPFASRVYGLVGQGLQVLVCVYFLASMRDDYFREWSINSDIKVALPVVEAEAARLGAQTIYSHPNYAASLRYYAVTGHLRGIQQILDPLPLPDGHRVYVLGQDESAAFLERNALRVVFRAKESDMAVAVAPPK